MRVAFIGGMGAGKTTQARRLSKDYGVPVVSLASGLKEIARDYFNIQSKCNPNARRVYHALGAMGRRIDPWVWIRHAVKQIEASASGAAIDDLRYPNEEAALANLGFRFVYLKVPVLERMRRIAWRDSSSLLNFRLCLRILRSMLHPSELLIPLVVHRAKARGKLIVVNGNQSEGQVWQEVKAGLFGDWRIPVGQLHGDFIR